MDQRAERQLSPYRTFTRAEWAALRADTPMTLEPGEIAQLRSLNDRLDMAEVEDIYLPLSRLLSLYVAATQRLFIAQQRFLGTEDAKMPYIIGVGGLGGGRQVDHRARAAGAAGALAQRAQGRSGHHRRLPLSQRGAGARRPDGEEGLSGELRPAGAAALPDRREGGKASGARAGLLASHLRRDAEPVDRDRPCPDILIVEGLNVLQAGRLPKDGKAIPFVSDFFDFSVYLDADEDVLRKWYVDRFLTLRATAFRDPKSYFHRYSNLSDAEAIETATSIWTRINLVNLHENILPTRQRADLILRKARTTWWRRWRCRRL